MKTFTTQEQDQLMEYATMVAKYAHMVAFLSAYPKSHGEMHHCRMNLQYFANQIHKMTEENPPKVLPVTQNHPPTMAGNSSNAQISCRTEERWRKERPNIPLPPSNVMINEAIQIPREQG